MNGVSFEVVGKPVPWARSGGNGKVRFTPAKVRHNQNLIKMLAAEAMRGRPPMGGPLWLTMTAVMPIPSSWSKRKQAQAVAGEKYPTGKPDLDNLVKSVKDACNQIVYGDDAQVVQSTQSKVYGERPRLIIEIAPVEGLAERVAA